MQNLEFLTSKGASFTVDADAISTTPHGANARLRRAMAEAIPTICTAFQVTRSQSPEGSSDPIMVVACADCDLGRFLITQRHGARLAGELTAPLVFAVSPRELLAMFQGSAHALIAELKALDPKDGEIVVALAVNLDPLALVKMRPAATAEEPAEDPRPDPAPTEGA